MSTPVIATAVSVLMALVLLTAGLAVPISGQVPAGWYVVSSFQALSPQPPWNAFQGPGGLWLLHPRTPGNPVQVSGLPVDLVGAPPAPSFSGANSVLLLPDGRLVVGEVGSNTAIDLHFITLTPGGSSVASATKVYLGTAGAQYGQVSQAALLPNGGILVAVSRLTSGPLGSTTFSQLGIVDYLNGNTVMTLPVVGLPSSLNYNALAVNAAGTIAYVGIPHSSLQVNRIYGVPLQGGIPPLAYWVADTPYTGTNWVTNLAIDNQGKLIVACGGQSGNLFSIDVQSAAPTVTPLGSPNPYLNAIAVERETGWSAVVAPLTNGQSVALEGNGVVLTAGPPNGWGAVSGVAAAPSLTTYGIATSSASSSMTWLHSPNPGGLPILGNTAFSVTIATPVTVLPGLWCLTTAPLNPPPLVPAPTGLICLNVDLLQALLWGSLTDQPLQSIPLPLPIILSLSGVSVYMQCMATGPAAGACASTGLCITII